MKSSLHLILLPINKNDGSHSVDVCGVVLYANRKLLMHLLIVELVACLHFILFLKVWTKHSASPFVDGWYVALKLCLMVLALQNDLNSGEVNYVPLSDTICSGIPCVANIFINAFIVLMELVDLRPFAIRIYNNKKIMSQKWTSIINTQSLPSHTRIVPRMWRYWRRISLL